MDVSGTDTTMYKESAVEQDDGGIAGNPLADCAVGVPGDLALNASQWRGLEPRLLDRIVRHLRIVLAIARLDDGLVGFVYTFAPRARIFVAVGCIIFSGHIPQVAGHVHGLMIADQRNDLAVIPQRLLLQPHEVLDDFE